MNSNFENMQYHVDNECFSLQPHRINEIFQSHTNSSKGITILNQNIRSFDKNFDEFSVYFQNYLAKIDVITFSETWFTDAICSPIPFYDGYHTVRPIRKGGGVSIYVKNGYRSSKLNKLSGIYSTFEVCATVVKINEAFELCVVALYRPPDTSISDFFLEFGEYLSHNFADTSNVVITGDFNIDISPDNISGNELSNLFQCYLYHSLINKPTRIQNQSQTIIDHMWSNMNIQFKSYILETDMSDHFTIALSFQVELSKKFILKSFRVHSEDAIENLVSEFNYFASEDGSLTEINFDEKLKLLIRKIRQLYDQYCPGMIKNISEND